MLNIQKYPGPLQAFRLDGVWIVRVTRERTAVGVSLMSLEGAIAYASAQLNGAPPLPN